MAKKTKKTKTVHQPGPIARWWWGLGTEGRRSIARAALTALFVVAVGLAGLWGLDRLRAYVYRQPLLAGSEARIELVDAPDWMKPWLTEQIKAELLGAPAAWTHDSQLAERVYQAALRCPWVRRVERVEVVRTPAGPGDGQLRDGCVRVIAQWRQPVALARQADGGGEQYIDAEGYVLPKAQVWSQRLPLIVGLAQAPPAPGMPWHGEDLQAGLELLARLEVRPWYDELTAIDVTNHDNRRNRYESAIELVAVRGQAVTRVRFGRWPMDGVPVGEPSIERKLGNLDGFCARNANRLAGQYNLDLRFSELHVEPY